MLLLSRVASLFWRVESVFSQFSILSSLSAPFETHKIGIERKFSNPATTAAQDNNDDNNMTTFFSYYFIHYSHLDSNKSEKRVRTLCKHNK